MGGSTTISDSGEKKNIDPKQLALVGVVLLAALGFGVKTMIGGESEETGFPQLTPSSPTPGENVTKGSYAS